MDENQYEMAEERQRMQIAESLARIPRYLGDSAKECADCGCDIPLLRREAVPGVQLCIDCAEVAEAGSRK